MLIFKVNPTLYNCARCCCRSAVSGDHYILGQAIAVKKALEREQKEMIAAGGSVRGGRGIDQHTFDIICILKNKRVVHFAAHLACGDGSKVIDLRLLTPQPTRRRKHCWLPWFLILQRTVTFDPLECAFSSYNNNAGGS